MSTSASYPAPVDDSETDDDPYSIGIPSRPWKDFSSSAKKVQLNHLKEADSTWAGTLFFSDRDPLPQEQLQNGSLCPGHLMEHSWVPHAHKDETRNDATERNGGDKSTKVHTEGLGGTTLVEPEREVDAEEYIGRKVRKRFGRRLFVGDIIGYDAEEKWYKIVYEDGDEEDLEVSEVEAILFMPNMLKKAPFKRANDKELERSSNKVRISKKQVDDGGISFNDDVVGADWFFGVPTTPKTMKPLSVKDAMYGSPSFENNESIKRRSGTGITLQEGINRYLQKLGNSGENFIHSGVKRKSLGEEYCSTKKRKTGKSEIMGTVDTARRATKESTRKIIAKEFEVLEELDDVNNDFSMHISKTKSMGDDSLKRFKIKASRAKDTKQKQSDDLEGVDTVKYRRKTKVVMDKMISPSKAKGDINQSNRDGTALVGSSIRKKFGQMFYSGCVTSFDQERQLFDVRYEDGDEEELEWSQLEPILWPEAKKGMKADSTSKESHDKSSRAVLAWRKLIGRPMRKEFNASFYNGTVISYDNKRKYFKVKYEDGDQEDLEWEELQALLGTDEDQLDRVRSSDKDNNLQSPLSAEPGNTLIGSFTRKKFGRKVFAGNVVKYDNRRKLYRVLYEDGDEESLYWKELEPTLVPKEDQDELAADLDHRGIALIGIPTKKKFKRKFYSGKVVGYNKKRDLYRVLYEDGDDEDLTWDSLKPTIVSKEDENVAADGGAGLIGKHVQKLFHRKFYTGTIVSYDKKTGFYKVTYDGDEEDLEWNELESIVLLQREHTTQVGTTNGLGFASIGRLTRRKINKKVYTGTVVSYNKKRDLYKVTYENGEEESLEWSDLKPLLLEEGQHKPITRKRLGAGGLISIPISTSRRITRSKG